MIIYRYIVFILLPGIRIVNKGGGYVMIYMILGIRGGCRGKWGCIRD